jgi:viologen exporter family transport system ATP-binding protein
MRRSTRSAAMSSAIPPNGLPCTAELTARRTMAATAVTRPVVIITPMLLEAIDVTIIVTMPPTKMRAHTMRKAFNVTRPCCQSGNPARVPARWSGTVAGVTEPAVQVRDLGKTFKVPEREPGLRAALGSLVRRRSRLVEAVSEVTFSIDSGEVVGFLGPNGAGKTTTLKMLSGLLHPSSGELSVLGYVPQRREREFLRRMTLVMGNRNQLQWDLPAADSFELNRAIYRIPRPDFERQRDELVDVLDVGDLLSKPVRNLSLGERMKMEIVASLLHQPSVLFLDEPTIGLDVDMQKRIRTFVAEYNRRHGACVLLTSHYMADVEALCRRVIVIHRGRILFDGQLAALTERFAVHKTIGVLLEQESDSARLAAFGEIVSSEGGRTRLRVDREAAPRIAAQLLSELPVLDLTVEDPPIEDVISEVFAEPSTR